MVSAVSEMSVINGLELLSSRQQHSSSNGVLHAEKLRQVWKVSNRGEFHQPVLYQPYGIAWCGSGIAVAEGFWPYSRIQTFDEHSGKSRSTSEQGIILPFDVAVANHMDGFIAVTDHHDRTVKILSSSTHDIISSWPAGAFRWPTGISCDQRGRFYVVDWSSGLATVCDASGQTISQFSTTCTSKFSRPVFVAVDSHRRIVISDAFCHVVRIFDEVGSLLGVAGSDAGKGKLADPRGVCVGPGGNLIVADWANNAVKEYSPDGEWIQDLLDSEAGVQNPWGVAMNDNGALAISEQKLSGTPALKLFV